MLVWATRLLDKFIVIEFCYILLLLFEMPIEFSIT